MYQSPFSTNEIKYFMNLMQNDNTEGKGATYAKLEILLSKHSNTRYVNLDFYSKYLYNVL